MGCRPPRWYTGRPSPWHGRCPSAWAPSPEEVSMASLKKMLAVTAMGVLVATPGFAQTGGTGAGGTGSSVGAGSTGPAPGIGAPGTTAPGGGLTPATPPSASPSPD